MSSDLIILKWNMKDDIYCWQSVFGCYRNIDSMQVIARLLYKSGICGSIQIISDGALVEDWSKGIARNSTEIFNEQMKVVLRD